MNSNEDMETFGTNPRNIDETRYMVTDRELTEKSKSYPMMDATVCGTVTKSVPDLLTGGQRKRKFAAVLSLAGLPGFDKMQDPVVIQSNLPKVLIDADSLETLRERCMAELEKMFNVFEDTINGTLNLDQHGYMGEMEDEDLE